jgi:hypothetical protein
MLPSKLLCYLIQERFLHLICVLKIDCTVRQDVIHLSVFFSVHIEYIIGLVLQTILTLINTIQNLFPKTFNKRKSVNAHVYSSGRSDLD